MSDRPKPRHFSMIRDFRLADLVTLCNGIAGMGSVLASMRYLVDGERAAMWGAFALMPVSLACDFLDGRIARGRGESSLLGQELDSLADAVAFGVAPAALGFALGLRGGWDALALVYFVGCGISRLARYNATAAALSDESGKVKYYEGTPIPTSLTIAIVLAILAGRGMIHGSLPGGAWTIGPFVLRPLSLLYVLSGSAMISKTLRIPKP